MRASQSQSQRAHQPLPLPLPPPPLCLPSPPAAPRRGRHHRSSCSSSSSSSSASVSSAASTFFFCPSPSPSPAPSPRGSTSSSLVPFSWERHPGVPKNSFRGGVASPTGTPLPLPPPLRQAPRRRRRRPRARVPDSSATAAANGDPFVAAFAECTRDDDSEDVEADHGADAVTNAAKEKLWLAPAKPTVSGRAARPWRTASGGFLGFLDVYGCKSAMAVADGAFLARRPVAARSGGPASGRATTRR